MPEQVNYDERLHAVYARGRALPAETMAMWMQVFSWHAGSRPEAVLDLGSGTGRFSPALAEAFGCRVYGVEPYERMRAVATKSASHPRVDYLSGSAEHIPLPDASCDLALMFFVLHHFRDVPAAAAELARPSAWGAGADPQFVLRPDARACLASLFPSGPEYRAGAVPLGQRGRGRLRRCRFSQVTLERVRQRVAPNLTAYAERLRLRALSTFEQLTEEEITAGFVALDAAAAAETVPAPVVDDCDLLVLAG